MRRFQQVVLGVLISLILFGHVSQKQSCAENPNATETKDSAVSQDPEEDPAYEPLRAKLAAPTSFEFKGAKLGDIAEVLSKQHGIQIKLDLAAKKFDPNTLITKKVVNLPLGSALGSMLRDYKLHLSIVDKDILSIDDGIHLVGVMYRIDDLLSSNDKDSDGKKFAEMVQRAVQGKSWKKHGGDGICNYYSPNKSLIIDNTQEVHDQVGEFLASLRRAKEIIR